MSRPAASFRGKPPLKGIFPLDHHSECRDAMKVLIRKKKNPDYLSRLQLIVKAMVSLGILGLPKERGR